MEQDRGFYQLWKHKDSKGLFRDSQWCQQSLLYYLHWDLLVVSHIYHLLFQERRIDCCWWVLLFRENKPLISFKALFLIRQSERQWCEWFSTNCRVRLGFFVGIMKRLRLTITFRLLLKTKIVLSHLGRWSQE